MNRVEATSSINILRPAQGSMTLATGGPSRTRVPFWVCLGMVLLGLALLGGSVGLRTKTEMTKAIEENDLLRKEVMLQSMRARKLHSEVECLSRDARKIEEAARALGMVKANEIVIVVK